MLLVGRIYTFSGHEHHSYCEASLVTSSISSFFQGSLKVVLGKGRNCNIFSLNILNDRSWFLKKLLKIIEKAKGCFLVRSGMECHTSGSKIVFLLDQLWIDLIEDFCMLANSMVSD